MYTGFKGRHYLHTNPGETQNIVQSMSAAHIQPAAHILCMPNVIDVLVKSSIPIRKFIY